MSNIQFILTIAVCAAATRARPSGSPASARWRRRVLVEETSCSTSRRSWGTVRYWAMLWADKMALSLARQ